MSKGLVSPVSRPTLSHYHQEFLSFVEAHPELANRACFQRFKECSPIESITHGYVDSTLKTSQVWPMLVAAEPARELHRVAVEMHRLNTEIPRRFFANDARQVSEFYGYDPDVESHLQRVLDLPWRPGGEIMRGDFILSQDVLKCIEINPTCYIGGLFTSNETFSHAVNVPLMQEFLRDQGVTVRQHLTWDSFLRLVIERAVARSLHHDGRLNVALAVAQPEEYSTAIPFMEQGYRSLLEKHAPETEGKILFCTYDQLSRKKDHLLVGGDVIHVLAQFYDDTMVAPVRLEVEAWLDGIIDLYAGPLGWLYNDKRNIALLSESADKTLFSGADGVFDHDEASFLNRHLPWTRLLVPGKTLYRGETVDLEALVPRERQKMVLKPAQTYGGASVHVGPFMSQDEWRAQVSEALSYGSYTVQEYLEPSVQTLQWGDSDIKPCAVIWGLFVMGGRFGGYFMRSAPRTKDGILNLASGAQIGGALELSSGEPGDDGAVTRTWSFRESAG